MGFGGGSYGRSITHIYFGPLESEPSDDILPPTKDPFKLIGGIAQKSRLGQYLPKLG